MNILYCGFRGGASVPFIGWPLIIIGAGFLVITFICWIRDAITDTEFAGGCFLSIFAIIIGIIAVADTRVPIVKATVNNEIPWVEVAKDYKYLDSEGDICIFEVLDTSVKDWELKINEQGK